MPDPIKGGYGADHGSSTNKSPGDLGVKADDLKSKTAAGVNSAADTLSHKAGEAKNAASNLASQAGQSAGSAAKDLKAGAETTAATLKDQAGQAASEAKSTVAAMAEEARNRITEIVDQQKAAGADTVAGVARAAQAAAGNLQQTSPQAARLVRSAAEGVDRLANDLRSSSMNDILGTLTEFGRRQPVAFFGGAVLAGFILARFLKSDAPAPTHALPPRNPRRV